MHSKLVSFIALFAIFTTILCVESKAAEKGSKSESVAAAGAGAASQSNGGSSGASAGAVASAGSANSSSNASAAAHAKTGSLSSTKSSSKSKAHASASSSNYSYSSNGSTGAGVGSSQTFEIGTPLTEETTYQHQTVGNVNVGSKPVITSVINATGLDITEGQMFTAYIIINKKVPKEEAKGVVSDLETKILTPSE